MRPADVAEVKEAAAKRWVDAVNADGRYGRWEYRIARKVADIPLLVSEVAGQPHSAPRA